MKCLCSTPVDTCKDKNPKKQCSLSRLVKCHVILDGVHVPLKYMIILPSYKCINGLK